MLNAPSDAGAEVKHAEGCAALPLISSFALWAAASAVGRLKYNLQTTMCSLQQPNLSWKKEHDRWGALFCDGYGNFLV